MSDSRSARGIYDLPPGVDPVAAVIQKRREAMQGTSPLEVLSIDSHGDRDVNATMFVNPFQVSGFKVIREANPDGTGLTDFVVHDLLKTNNSLRELFVCL